MDKYASERFNPQIPRCIKSSVYLKFDGKHLTLGKTNSKQKPIDYIAASGKPVNGKFVYTKERQKKAFHGPIPEGEYWINPEELWENAWYKSASTSAWGNYRITIHPYPTTVTYGRGGFFIHGGDILGSAGCIDLVKQMDKFVKDMKAILLGNTKCYIPLSVKY